MMTGVVKDDTVIISLLILALYWVDNVDGVTDRARVDCVSITMTGIVNDDIVLISLLIGWRVSHQRELRAIKAEHCRVVTGTFKVPSSVTVLFSMTAWMTL